VRDASWEFPLGDVLYDVPGSPPLLFLGATPRGDEAVVTWTGDDRFELDLALAGGRVLHETGRYATPSAAQVAVASIAARAHAGQA
jgi:hypothetical protein